MLCELARRIYRDNYLGSKKVGELQAHDSSLVLFHEDRFEHAFFTSSNRTQFPKKKDVLDRKRVERIRWIKPIIEGRVKKTACYLLIDRDQGNRHRRLYLAQDHLFVIWLEPRQESGWNFSSAYTAMTMDVRRYCKSGKRIWVAP